MVLPKIFVVFVIQDPQSKKGHEGIDFPEPNPDSII